MEDRLTVLQKVIPVSLFNRVLFLLNSTPLKDTDGTPSRICENLTNAIVKLCEHSFVGFRYYIGNDLSEIAVNTIREIIDLLDGWILYIQSEESSIVQIRAIP